MVKLFAPLRGSFFCALTGRQSSELAEQRPLGDATERRHRVVDQGGPVRVACLPCGVSHLCAHDAAPDAVRLPAGKTLASLHATPPSCMMCGAVMGRR